MSAETIDKLPGIDILNKYQPDIDIKDNIIIIVKKKVTHFDRQELFALGWKQNEELIFSLDLNLI